MSDTTVTTETSGSQVTVTPPPEGDTTTTVTDPPANNNDPAEDTDPDGDTFDPDKAREKIRKVNSEAAGLRKRLAAEEQANKANAEKGDKVPALEAEILRLRVGVKHGLPESLVKRLTGTTEEELLQDAEELMSMFGSKKPPTDQPRENLRGGGDPTQEPKKPFNSDEFAAGIFAR